MSDIIRALNQCKTEQEQLQTQRIMARMIRAGRQSPVPNPEYTPPGRPVFPGGIVPVQILSMPRRFIR
jgi:hypothetical protein